MSVYIGKVEKYDINLLVNEIKSGLKAINFSLANKKSAIIKPNLVIPVPPDSSVITHPAVTEAIIQVLRENGITNITILETPGLGLDFSLVFQTTGYADLAKKLDVPLISIRDTETCKIDWKFGKISVPKIILETDLYINACKLKTHCGTTITLSIKNQKGIIGDEDKKNFHRLGLNDTIAEFSKVVRPHLNIVDGIIGMEGDGPTNGTDVNSKALLISENMVEIDSAGASIMGFDLQKIEYLMKAEKLGVGTIHPETIGEPLEKLTKKYIPSNPDFANFFNLYSIRNCYACSLCIGQLNKAVKVAIFKPKYWFSFLLPFIFYTFFRRINIVQGKNSKYKNYLKENSWNVCFGICTKSTAEENKFAYIQGCPPHPEDILKYFFKKPQQGKN